MSRYDDWRKQEALQTLGDPANLRPILNGMISTQRLEAYFEVAEEIGVDDEQWQLLREHRDYLEERNNVDVDFSADYSDVGPSVDAEAEPAVADGGAVVETHEDGDADEDEWEPRADQTVVEYEGQQRESLKQSVLSLLSGIDDVDALQEKLENERDSDRVRPHAIDALEERIEEVTA